MEQIVITGGNPLFGNINISGAKNAALPLMACALLTDEVLNLSNVPKLADIETLSKLLEGHGTKITHSNVEKYGFTLNMHTEEIISTVAPYELVCTMRASVLVLGPLLARKRQARVSLPGGCAIGARPVDLHLKGLEAMGASIEIVDGYIVASAPKGLQGAVYEFSVVSVGATENIMMAASLANGTTILHRSAREPEIVDLAKCLNAMGAKISGAGTDTIVIEGVDTLHGANHKVLADRIEAGSFACVAGACGGDITLTGIAPTTLDIPLGVLCRAGVEIIKGEDSIRIIGKALHGVDITTEPYPGFPTDLQAQFMAMFSVASGSSVISETIFENRFMHVPELSRLGANIALDGNVATVRGVEELHGTDVMATDLRASMGLVIAGLKAVGQTRISRIYHLDRGYSGLEEKLKAVGADIERIARV